MTRFGKTCIVHTSNFPQSRIYKIWKEQYTELKFAGMIEEWKLYNPCKFQVYLSYLTDFMNLQILKIGCVNYTHFCKSGHILLIMSLSLLSVCKQGTHKPRYKQLCYIHKYYTTRKALRSVLLSHEDLSYR